jgi:IS5 family transposase
MFDEVEGGLVTRYAVLAGNPPDAPELPHSLAHHQACFGQVPTLITADRAFFTLDNERLAYNLRIPSVALPRPGPLTPTQKELRRSATFQRAYRWRAGIEGRISVLKRRFGLDRCRYHGEAGMERWVGWGVLAHNFRQISRSVATNSAR